MKSIIALSAGLLVFMLSLRSVSGGLLVPPEVEMPGTQPQQVNPLDAPNNNCNFCHGGYDPATEPNFKWQSGMMSHAARDPVFWAVLAVSEQDFDGSGDFCLRCHSPGGWLGGRSTPTDGSALAGIDAEGVTCDACHKLATPDGSEWPGVQTPPFIANDRGAPPKGYYGSAMYTMFAGPDKMGPYASATAPHAFRQAAFVRKPEFCGTCHDVSNPVVGDLAPNHGTQPTADPVVASGVLGSPNAGKAAFNNFPHKYGIVERTFSEHMASALPTTPVSAYSTLPADLRTGAIKAAYDAAIASSSTGNYEDGTARNFTCQTCHLPPATGQGCSLNPPVRKDLPDHDMTGGNYWVPDVIKYLDSKSLLRLGGGLTATQRSALDAGKLSAQRQLTLAAALTATATSVKVVNTTGHKLISGYPEGRRMWLNMKWYDASGVLLREDGKYAPITAMVGGVPRQVNTILDLGGTNTRIYEVHNAITQEWAAKLIGLGTSPSLPLGYDRVTGAVTSTLGQLAAQAPGTYRDTFHFVLNNHVSKDNRIPSYGMSYEESRKRNVLPVPASQFGNPGPAGVYNYWDDVPLNPPAGAVYASIGLLYQPTSWEYVLFLERANTRQDAFLGNEGAKLLDAWLNTGMAEPYVMAAEAWGTDADSDGLADQWEQQFGLNPNTADANADPDGDGATNAEEYVKGTHPRGFNTRYLAEGAASSFFDASFALFNTGAAEAKVLLRYQLPDGSTTSRSIAVPPMSRRTVTTADQPALSSQSFSTIVESDVAVVVERTMAWDGRRYGAHAEASTGAPASTWFLAEGATHSGFQTFYLLQNANAQQAQVTVTWLLPAPAAPVQRTYTVEPNSRFNVWVNDEARSVPALRSTDLAARITSDRPITVERAMYLDTGGRVFGAGHAAAGVTAPSLTWVLAEGATGSYFDQYVLVANPNASASIMDVRFLLNSGVVITRPYTIAGNSRLTIAVDDVDPQLASATVSTTVTVTNGVPVVVERTMWWPGPTPATWHEAHNSAGIAETAVKWAVAGGEQGGTRDARTFLLVTNPGAVATSVRVTLVFESGGTAERTFPVGPTTRFNVDVAAHFPAASGRLFGAIVESLGGALAPIAVERSTYWDAEAVVWAAGTNTPATRIP